MPAAFSTLLLTNNTTLEADLVDGVNFQLLDNSWSPAVSSRRIAQEAGKSPYEEVLEEISLVVRGATGAAALANLATLTQLLDQADQFRDGDLVDPVVLVCQPQGSVVNPVTALVMGRPPSAGGMGLPASFNDRLHIYEIAPVALRFVRSGLWYGEEDTPAATAAAANPSVQSVVFTDSPVIPGPTRVTYAGFGNDTADLSEGYVLIASNNFKSPNALQIVEGETGSADVPGVTLAVTNDAANDARANEIAEITDPSTTDYEAVSFLLPDPVDDRRAYVLAAMRNNTAATWYVYAATKGSSGHEGTPTKIVKITGDNNNPQIVSFGICYNPENHNAIRLYFKCSTTAGSPQLDIDYLAILGMDNRHNYVTHIIPGAAVDEINEFSIDPAPLTAVGPVVQATDDTVLDVSFPLGYDGDMWLATVGNPVKAAWFATRGTAWRWTVTAGTVLSPTLSMARRPGYLTPQ